MSGMVGYLLFNGLIGNAFHVLSVQLTYTIWILKHVESECFGSAEQFLFWPSISLLSRFQTRIKPVVITMKFNRDKSNTGSSPSKNFAAGLSRGYGTIPPQWRRKRKWKPWGTQWHPFDLILKELKEKLLFMFLVYQTFAVCIIWDSASIFTHTVCI